MTLTSLKKRAPSVKRAMISVEQFIDEAELYAQGLSCERQNSEQQNPVEESEVALRRATFTLGEQAIDKLAKLSVRSGIAKSRLIRIWLDNESKDGNLFRYLNSAVK